MEENQIKRSALLNSYFRAYHAQNDNPKIFDDFLACQFLTEDELASIEQLHLMFLQQAGLKFTNKESALAWAMQAPSSPALVLARAPFAEECLEKAIEEGVRQYVIMGAGMDTFAFRRTELVQQLQVFEIDHPATQAFKRRRLAELGWKVPEQLHFVPMDFTQENLTEALINNTAYNPKVKTFFSWMGVTYYLTRNEVVATLKAITDIAPKHSMVVFDYLDSDAFIPEKAAPRIQAMLLSVQQIGEPMKSGFNPCTIATDLSSIGMRLEKDMSPWNIQLRYFMGRNDFYHACEQTHFILAVVD